MVQVTSAQQGMGQQFNAGMRSSDPSLTPFQRAQLRAIEQGSGANLNPYGARQDGSSTRTVNPGWQGGPAMNGMGANGQQMPPMSTPLAGTQGMTSPTMPGSAAFTGNTPVGSPIGGGTGLVNNPPMGGTPPRMNPAFTGSDPTGAASAGGPTLGGSPPGTYGAGGTGGPMQTQPVGGATPFTGANFGGGGGAAPQTGLIGAEAAYKGGLDGGMGAVNQFTGIARNDVSGATQGANNTLNPFYQAGGQSNNRQAALSGALGNDAQKQAMDGFMGSPGQQYLLNESERAIKRNAAATGGLGGGNVQRALQENAIGLAAQDFDNAFNRMGSISDRGLAAGGQISGNMMTAGGQMSGLAQNAGNLSANMIYGTGNNLAAGRTRAGEMIAGNIADSTSNLANISSQSGDSQSDVIGQGGLNLANLLAGAGRDTSTINQQLATLLANIATGSASQVGGLPGLGGTQQNPGMLGGIGDALSGVGAFMAASDARLKENITKIGEYGGVNLYSWDWNEEGVRVAGGQPTTGVIAQEVPHAAVGGSDGYLRVNYARVW